MAWLQLLFRRKVCPIRRFRRQVGNTRIGAVGLKIGPHVVDRNGAGSNWKAGASVAKVAGAGHVIVSNVGGDAVEGVVANGYLQVAVGVHRAGDGDARPWKVEIGVGVGAGVVGENRVQCGFIGGSCCRHAAFGLFQAAHPEEIGGPVWSIEVKGEVDCGASNGSKPIPRTKRRRLEPWGGSTGVTQQGKRRCRGPSE